LKIIFQINGGIGKSIASTGVIRAIKDKYPDHELIVITAYPDVFLNNPFVDRCFGPMNYPYFYEKFILPGNVITMLHDPYLETEHILGKEHLIQTWARMNGLDTWYAPELYITQREVDFYGQKFSSDKPIFLMQTNGGAVGQESQYSWARDIPKKTAESVIEEFRDTHNIVHVRREDQMSLEGTIPVHDGVRGLVVLASISEKRLLIDSFLQHVCAAIQLSSTVCWVVNKPEVFGYPLHTNILANPFTNPYDYKHSFFHAFDILGKPEEFPYHHEGEIFETDTIIKSLKS
jgi:hypothetical protein